MNKKITRISIVIAIIIVILLSCLLVINNLSWLDTPIYNTIYHHLINDSNTSIFKFITELGNSILMVPIAIITFFLIRPTKKYSLYGAMLFFIWGSSYITNVLLKDIFQRSRPSVLRLVNEYDYSFPSGHAMVSICFYGFIIYMIIKLMKHKIKYVLVGILSLLILLIGFSRIYLGVHYTSDVIAGYSYGFIWLLICILFLKRLLKLQKE